MLLDLGEEIRTGRNYMKTAQHLGVEDGREAVVEMPLDRGAKIEFKNTV